jgi:CubicO group peptidase (beta-lactamase class C family)
VTSGDETLWTKYHTAQQHNKQRPGVTYVDGNSQYRIASVTKVFTVLGLLYQHAAGNLSLDDPVDKYITELRDDGGAIPWKHITLRSLASQLYVHDELHRSRVCYSLTIPIFCRSGIPRDFAAGFVEGSLPDPNTIGLPPPLNNRTLPCPDVANNGSCTSADLLRALKQQNPVFAPDSKSTYSNDAFSLLGLVIERVTGETYSRYVTKEILEPLEMSSSSFEKPSDDYAVLPVGSEIWDCEKGVGRPTGGLYASSSDMSKFLRHVLKNYNSIATGENWLSPASWGTGMSNFYGMPWEIFRSDKILEDTGRPVTFYTKSGGLPGYFSLIALLPEYNLGVTLLVGGDQKVLANLRDLLLPALVKAAERAMWEYVADQYAGEMVATDHCLNSSLTLASSPKDGLTITNFISNGTDVLKFVVPRLLVPDLARQGIPWHAQLIPTMLFKNESSEKGEIWRMLIVESRTGRSSVLDGWCVSDIDGVTYKGIPINEVVFWREQGLVEFSAFEVVFKPDVGEKAASFTYEPGYIGQLQKLFKLGF